MPSPSPPVTVAPGEVSLEGLPPEYDETDATDAVTNAITVAPGDVRLEGLTPEHVPPEYDEIFGSHAAIF